VSYLLHISFSNIFFCHYRNESIERRAAEPTALTSYALGIFLLASAENEALYCDYVCLYQSDHVIQIFLPFVN
jgi:hypothetical protein